MAVFTPEQEARIREIFREELTRSLSGLVGLRSGASGMSYEEFNRSRAATSPQSTGQVDE
jgi:hypothetical protein